jgi:hypothetical protein
LSWVIRGGASADLEELQALFDAEPELVSGEGTTSQVYRGQYQQRSVFLKISRKERWKVLLPRLLVARCWCSSVDLEARNLLRLQDAGIPVIPILGHGSRYVLGVPVSGVMLSAAVAGVSLEDALMEGRSARLELAQGYGRVAARLHLMGGYEPLRAKDFMVENGQLMLLDREKPLGAPGWRQKRAMTSLERAWFRNRRSGLRLDQRQCDAWLESYCSEAGLAGKVADRVKVVVRRYCGD